MLTQNLQLCVGGSLENEVCTGGWVIELPPVVPRGVHTCGQNYITCVNWERALARASSILLYMSYVLPLLHKASFLMICLGIKEYGNESRKGHSYPNHLPRTAAAILRKWLGWIRDYQTQNDVGSTVVMLYKRQCIHWFGWTSLWL